MKIIYLATIRFPTEKAHGLQIAKMCQAFSLAGFLVNLVVPARFQANPELQKISWQEFYAISKKFKLTRIFSIDFLRFNHLLPSFFHYLTFLINKISFYFMTFFYLIKSRKQKAVIFSREYFSLLIGWIFKMPVFLEIHDFPRTRIGLAILIWVFGKADGMIVTNKDFYNYLQNLNFNKQKLFLAPNAVDKRFLKPPGKFLSRKTLGLDKNLQLAAYCGSLSVDKGINCLLAAAKKISTDSKIKFIICGQNYLKKEQDHFSHILKNSQLKNVIYLGFVKNSQIPQILSAADILIMPNSGKSRAVYKKFLSPLKLYEYIAVKRPILASGVPGLKSILENKISGLFFTPNDSEDLAKKLLWLFKHPKTQKFLARQAFGKVTLYTWEQRAKLIDRFIKRLTK